MKKIIFSIILIMFVAGCSQDPAKYEDLSDEFFSYDKYVDSFVKLAERPLATKVKKGQSLHSIAKTHGLNVEYLMSINGMTNSKLKNGQTILLTKTKFHRVKKGDNLSYIAASYNSSVESISLANNLDDKRGRIKAGDFLTIPLHPDREYSQIYEENELVQPKIKEKKPISSPKNVISPKKKSLNIVNVAKKPKAKALTKFIWPIKGKVISKFGPTSYGTKNDGINILAKKGSFIASSNKGRVVYAGSGLKSYGNLVIIKHDSGWLTAYAHMNKVLVKKGDIVEKSQHVGIVGNTGEVKLPQLHFAMRRFKKPVNPELYLK